ncbi:MAG: magnesium/cobalt transporter CorA [Halofilum sp. (in: g-proteobacteria)]|nr:magnesium/cobalt transporter CorA [Halofilum sp. (in: g-proteobacteria)]
MIRNFHNQSGRLHAVDGPAELQDSVVWIDLVDPTNDEETTLERQLGLDLPARAEMEEIEISSRLYYEDGASFMTATLPAQTESNDPQMLPVTFVLTPERLVTIRYHEPGAFKTFPVRAAKAAPGCDTGEGVLVALLEAIVDRIADILERAGRDIDGISRQVFKRPSADSAQDRDFQVLLESIGGKGDLTSNIRDSLLTLERLVGFLSHGTMQRRSGKDVRERVKTLARDVRSLSDHASFLSQKTTFLLDATLGMLNIEQNATIKIFSVVAVIFLPPTLIASIYGMNFEFMPELEWPFGYPFALVLMVLSAVLPFAYFKFRHWL